MIRNKKRPLQTFLTLERPQSRVNCEIAVHESETDRHKFQKSMFSIDSVGVPSVLCVGTLWVPHDDFMTRTLANLESIESHILTSETFVILTGFVSNDDHWSVIEEIVSRWPADKVSLQRSSTNVGKATLVNEAVKQFCEQKIQNQPKWPMGRKPFDVLLTWDADIVFTEPIVHKYQELTKLHKHGIVAPMQDIECCHLLKILRLDASQKWYTSARGGIAGGCWFIKYETWTSIGGYPVFGVYASDDGTFLNRALQKRYSCVVSLEIHVEHVNVKFTGYANWKAKNSPRIQNLPQAQEDANQFWQLK